MSVFKKPRLIYFITESFEYALKNENRPKPTAVFLVNRSRKQQWHMPNGGKLERDFQSTID